MSRITSLKQRIEKIPETQNAMRNIGLLKQESKTLERIRIDYERATQILEIFETETTFNVNADKQSLKNLSKSAQAIKSLFDDFDNFSQIKYDNWLVKHKNTCPNTIERLSNIWRAHVNKGLARYKNILNVASSANLSGANEMSAELVAIENDFKNVPETANEIRQFEQRISEFPKYISTLGLSSKIEDFLKKASSTGADPNLLYDSEIMEFLQSNPGLLAQMRLKIAG